MKKLDFIVFIGRFQPFHLGHLDVVEQALQKANKVIILLGSSHQPRTTKNPWTAEEREKMIRGAIPKDRGKDVFISPLMDIPYNDKKWVRSVRRIVDGIITSHHTNFHREHSIGLIGHFKDSSSFYLKLFPEWELIEAKNTHNINATELRNHIFDDRNGYLVADSCVHPNVSSRLMAMAEADHYEALVKEHTFLKGYKESWAGSPFPPTFTTVDSVVICDGRVLLIERKNSPGKGLLALPGGFLDQGETIQEASLRELKEETSIEASEEVLVTSLASERIFDHPNRSTRGRTITHAFLYDLSGQPPSVTAGDDAAHAYWARIDELSTEKMYEDHFHIIHTFLNEEETFK